jgi:hypothetical protein
MDLLGIESTRIILLMQAHRPSGQLYLPDAMAKLVARYSFLKAPNPEQPLPYTFAIGKFRDIQIAELSIYNDGLILSSASDSDILDEFLDDLLSWAGKEFEILPVPNSTPEKSYESTVIVKSTTDISAILKPTTDISGLLSDAMKNAKIDIPLRFAGAIFDFDIAEMKRKRKPLRLVIDRRVGLPFSENIFFSQAPFRTKDHLAVLKSLEQFDKL